MNKLADIKQAIEESKNVLILAAPPDEDSICSSIILKHILASKGKNVRSVFRIEIPEKLRYIPFLDEIETLDPTSIDFSAIDLVITVDAGVITRITGSESNFKFPENLKVICIDHHEDDELFTNLNLIENHVSSTVEIIYKYFIDPLNLEDHIMTYDLNKEEATLLLAGLIGETKNFKWSMSSDVFEIAQRLVTKGADNSWIINYEHFNRSPAFHKFVSYMAPKIEFHEDLGFTLLLISLDDIKQMDVDFSNKDNYTPDFHEMFTGIYKGFPAGGILIEYQGYIRGTFRGNEFENKIDLPKLLKTVSPIAGGHKHAAGITIKSISLQEAKAAILKAVREYIP